MFRHFRAFFVKASAELRPASFPPILSHMANHDGLDGVFVALADPTRRRVVHRLGRGPASVTELARPFPMALPSFLKHIRALESAGLVRTAKQGRVRMCTLDRERLALVGDWLEEQRRVWEERTDRLERLVTEIEEEP